MALFHIQVRRAHLWAIGLVLTIITLFISPVQARSYLENSDIRAPIMQDMIQSYGGSVNVFKQSTLDKRAVTRIDDFQYQIPNLMIARGLPDYRFTLRGLGSQAVIGAATDPGFAIYVNGVYVARPEAAGLDYFDFLESVELLRGPQGTLYGRNSIAGTLNITYKKPAKRFESFGDVQIGDYGQQRYRFVVNSPLPLSGGKAVIRLAGLFETRDGYYETPNAGQELNDEDQLRVRTALLLEPYKDVSIITTWTYNRDRGNGYDTKLVPAPQIEIEGASGDLREGDEDYPQTQSGLSHFVTLVGEWTPRDLPFALKSTSGYQSARFYYNGDHDQTSEDILRLTLWDDMDAYSTELEIRSANESSLQFAYLRPLKWVTGFNYWYEKTPTNGGFDEWGKEGGTGNQQGSIAFFNSDSKFKEYAWAFFGQASYEIEGARLVLGVRYGVTDREFDDQSDSFTGDGDSDGYTRTFCLNGGVSAIVISSPTQTLPSDGGRCKDNWEAWTWKAGVDYAVPTYQIPYLDEQLIYFTASTGHRPGGFNFNQDPAIAPVKDEYLYAYELGVKNMLWSRRIALNLTGFYYDVSDLQATQTIPGVSPFISNIPSSEIYGVELEMQAQLLKSNLLVNFGFGYQESKIKSSFCMINYGIEDDLIADSEDRLPGTTGYIYTVKDDDSCAGSAAAKVPVGYEANERIGPAKNVKGNDLPYVPRFNLTMGAEYKYSMNLIRGHIIGRADYVWRDDVQLSSFNLSQDEAGAYGLLHLRLIYSHRSARFGAQIYMTNVLDEEAVTNIEISPVNRSSGDQSGENSLAEAENHRDRVVYLNDPQTYGIKFFIRY